MEGVKSGSTRPHRSCWLTRRQRRRRPSYMLYRHTANPAALTFSAVAVHKVTSTARHRQTSHQSATGARAGVSQNPTPPATAVGQGGPGGGQAGARNGGRGGADEAGWPLRGGPDHRPGHLRQGQVRRRRRHGHGRRHEGARQGDHLHPPHAPPGTVPHPLPIFREALQHHHVKLDSYAARLSLIFNFFLFRDSHFSLIYWAAFKVSIPDELPIGTYKVESSNVPSEKVAEFRCGTEPNIPTRATQ